ncbi:MAG TPA: DNA gyrase inhibitor YacG [Gammaproteobacteria bacterium]|nr:DNA gyrase inhibitor YacG [Gammaproteobacteria bacterium]
MGRCPTCGKPAVLSADNPARPFCSPRCRLIDLGEWLDERRRIPGPPAGDPAAPGDDSDA